MIRVLIADDSSTVRAYLKNVLETDTGIAVVSEVADGPSAVAATEEIRPDLVVMDVHMPGCDGLEATRQIMSSVPTPIIIISGAGDNHGVALSLSATEAGALMAMPKPSLIMGADHDVFGDELRSMVRAMSEVKLVRRWKGERSTEHRDPLSPPPSSVSMVGVGASTGGPVALRTVLSALPGDFPVPILIVQHIANGFVEGLRDWMASETDLTVEVGTQGSRIRGGTVYIAPDDQHLVVIMPGYIGLTTSPPVGRFRPSASVLFESMAKVAGPSSIAVVMTGMGNDGVAGATKLRDAGGYVIAQNQSSSVVYGMAQEASRAGIVSEELALTRIAGRLESLAGGYR